MRFLGSFLALTLLLLAHSHATDRGVIDDPDGYTNLRAAQSTSSAIVARVNAGEVFEFSSSPGEPPAWIKVTLRNGQTGWMHHSRIRFHVDLTDLKDGGPDDEVNQDKDKGFAYYPTARLAAKGDPKALHTLFSYRGDGAAAESHDFVATRVIHLAGDDRMSAFISAQPANWRRDLRLFLTEGPGFWPFEPKEYLRLHFPKIATALALK